MALHLKTETIHGRPCRHGHGTLRYASNNQCVECKSLEQKWRRIAQNRAQREWYAHNREKTNAKNRKWHAANRGKVAARKKRLYQANSEKIKANSRKWYLANREKTNERGLKWCRENPEKAAVKAAYRRAYKLRATPPWLTAKHKKEMINFYRKAKQLNLVVDHIVPLKGEAVCGLHVPWNLQLLTQSENSHKGNSLGG